MLGTIAALAIAQAFTPPGRNHVGWWQSPNFDPRPQGAVVDTIVLHHTAGTSLASTAEWFADPASRVSAHFTVGKDGSIVQHVSTYERAWHAGASRDTFGREGVNAFSVGIEIDHEGRPGEPYTAEQVEAVEHLVSVLVRRFPIRLITSHMAIATPAGRKPDPVDYPWRTLYRFNVPIVP